VPPGQEDEGALGAVGEQLLRSDPTGTPSYDSSLLVSVVCICRLYHLICSLRRARQGRTCTISE
jgi:hypothetical protein